MMTDALRTGIRRACWDALGEWAARARREQGHPQTFRFSRNDISDEENLRAQTLLRAKAAGLPVDIGKVYDPSRYPEGAQIEVEVRAVYQEALQAGFIVPGSRRYLNPDPERGVFMFTQRGIDVLAHASPRVASDGSLRDSLSNARSAEGLQVTEAQIELLAEAQRCWLSRCHRAAIVMIGLANEDCCLALVDAMPLHLKTPTDPDLKSAWSDATSVNNVFAARWRPALRVLAAARKALQPQLRRADWGRWWQGVPGCLETLGEAVRLSRNAAAHEPSREFGRAEVALLLASMPHQLRVVTELTSFLTRPPGGVVLPGL